MRPGFLRAATRVYRAIPWRGARAAGYALFARLVRGRRVVAVRDGAAFELELGEKIDLAVFVGRFEPEVARAIDALCRPGMVALDVGANMGAHTLRLARGVGEAGRVYAFEPTDAAYARLERNLALNPFPQAVAQKLALSDRNLPARPVRFRASWRTDGRPGPEVTGTAPFARLDDWCAERGVERVDLVKLDVDGNEIAVLRGAMETLRRSRPVVVAEAVWPHFERDETNPFLLLEGLGYRFRDARTGAGLSLDAIRARLPEGDREMRASVNLIGEAHGAGVRRTGTAPLATNV